MGANQYCDIQEKLSGVWQNSVKGGGKVKKGLIIFMDFSCFCHPGLMGAWQVCLTSQELMIKWFWSDYQRLSYELWWWIPMCILFWSFDALWTMLSDTIFWDTVRLLNNFWSSSKKKKVDIGIGDPQEWRVNIHFEVCFRMSDRNILMVEGYRGANAGHWPHQFGQFCSDSEEIGIPRRNGCHSLWISSRLPFLRERKCPGGIREGFYRYVEGVKQLR